MIYVASYPRSGNTLFRLALYYHFGIECGSVYNNEIELEGKLSGVLNTFKDTKFIKTHKLPECDNITEKTILIVRDGRDSLLSLIYFIKNFRDQSSPYIQDFNMTSNNWSNFYIEWLKHDCIVIEFKELISDTYNIVRNTLKDLNVMIVKDDKEMPSFESFKENNNLFFRHGKVGDWKDELPKDIVDEFISNNYEMMKYFKYI
jgi:hypothetical protein